jgi:hypothetical protein
MAMITDRGDDGRGNTFWKVIGLPYRDCGFHISGCLSKDYRKNTLMRISMNVNGDDCCKEQERENDGIRLNG